MRQNMRLRCWDKEKQIMLPSFPLYKSCFAHNERTSDMIIMLGTGLRDRTGKDIFEGDIIKIESLSYGTFSAPVEYFRGRARFGAVTWTDKTKQITLPAREWDKPHPPCGCDGAMYEAMSILDTHETFAEKNEMVEVIGNVYEGEGK